MSKLVMFFSALVFAASTAFAQQPEADAATPGGDAVNKPQSAALKQSDGSAGQVSHAGSQPPAGTAIKTESGSPAQATQRNPDDDVTDLYQNDHY
ncbi:MAG: hypothetical protein PHW13_04700 [Methylococcales bacterium]|nr:hypothetical protein [Methylococcales bacterium]